MIHSLHSKIKLIFIIAAFLLTALLGVSMYVNHQKVLAEKGKRYTRTAMFILRYFRHHDSIDENLQSFLQEHDFNIVEEKPKGLKLLREKKVFRHRFRIYKEKKNFYLEVMMRDRKVFLQDKLQVAFPLQNLLTYLAALVLLLTLYLWIIRSLKPLKSLQQEIQKFADGDLNISCKSDKKDEIALVANEFDKAAKTIEKLITSRQLFLRTIMHELKTPIAKGRIVSAMVSEESQNEMLESVFTRLELLLEEFSKIEQMLSSGYQLNLQLYRVRDIVDQSVELLMVDEKRVTIAEKEPIMIESDFSLLSLALKNLIDNALKYSSDKKTTIMIKKTGVTVASFGAPLAHALQSYFQPFHNQSDAENAGLGLGLYIVNSITELLHMHLSYEHREGMNRFTITFV